MDTDLMDEATGDLPVPDSEPDLIALFFTDTNLTIIRECAWAGAIPAWSDCAGLSPELRLWHLQFGNLSIDSDDRLWRRRAPPCGTARGSSNDIMILYSQAIWVFPELFAGC